MRKAGWIAAGVAGTAAVAAAAWYLRDRNLEQPEYFMLIDDGALELRDYPALIAAETLKRGPRDKALAAGLRLLEGYIAGRARGGPRIARTAP
ncbi:MAG: heme-binding protein, partial [Sphingomonadaceae bacterium]|nr:heme-binding protein [Sphingomonadaceae bacterium]